MANAPPTPTAFPAAEASAVRLRFKLLVALMIRSPLLVRTDFPFPSIAVVSVPPTRTAVTGSAEKPPDAPAVPVTEYCSVVEAVISTPESALSVVSMLTSSATRATVSTPETDVAMPAPTPMKLISFPFALALLVKLVVLLAVTESFPPESVRLAFSSTRALFCTVLTCTAIAPARPKSPLL